MALNTIQHRKPAITVTRSDHKRLSLLADTFSSKNPEVAEQLFVELDRARVVQDGRIGKDVVRIGSTLRFTTDNGDARRVTLVFPGEADIAEGKISILTPVGAALLGLSAGQSINWTARDGRAHRLTVDSVDARAEPPVGTPAAELRSAS